jgi:glycosyltransferase involved in cell wall biosynthesis
VLLLNHSGEISGAEISLLETARVLTERGIDVLLGVPEHGDLADRIRSLRLPMRTASFPAPRMTTDPRRVVRGLGDIFAGARRVVGMLAGEAIDVVHANSVRAGLMASVGRPFHRRPVIWSVRDFLPATTVGLAIRLVGWVSGARFLANSRAVAAQFACLPALQRRTEVVYPALTDAAFDPGPCADLRATWGIPGAAFLVGYVGQIAPWKRIHDAVRALEVLASERHDVRLVIVGAAKFRPENHAYLDDLHRLVEGLGLTANVTFAGFVEPVRAVYRSLDVLLHPAEAEPFGRVLVEAMAQGVPVIAARDGGVPEIVEEGISGLLFPVGDVVGIAARLRELLSDPRHRRRLGMRGKERAREVFHVDCTIPGLLRVYGAVARPRS